MEHIKKFIEVKLTVEQRIELIKSLMNVDMIYKDIKKYIITDLNHSELNELHNSKI